MISVVSIAERLGRAALRARGIASRTVPTSIGRVHVFQGRGRGSLPPVVVLHGIGSAAVPFGPVMGRLTPHVRGIVAPDFPGHGWSEPPHGPLTPEVLFEVMVDVLDRVLDEPAVVLGNSLGGAVALRYARERPARVKGLVLLSPAGARMSDDEIEDIRRAFHMPTRSDARAFLARVYHRAPPIAPLIASGVRERLQRAPVRELLRHVRPDQHATPEELGALSMPVLLVWGRSERLLPPSSLAYFREHLPSHAQVIEPDHVGHCPHFDDPAWVARRVIELARSVG